MGTYYTIKYINPAFYPLKINLQKEINLCLNKINNQMSTYLIKSELNQFNQFKKINIPFLVSKSLIKVIKEAIKINKLTYGSLDITLGSIINLWGFGPHSKKKIPSINILKLHRLWNGMNNFIIKNNTLIKKKPHLAIDLSSVAKGYAVDVLAKHLESKNISNYMINIGGEIRTKGYNSRGVLWRIAIEKPCDHGLQQLVQKIVQLNNMSIATSGNYRNYFKDKNIYYSHIINPYTGKPITNNVVSTTVIASNCMFADGMATSLQILGVKKGMKLAEYLKLPVLMIIRYKKGFKEIYSSTFHQYLINIKS